MITVKNLYAFGNKNFICSFQHHHHPKQQASSSKAPPHNNNNNNDYTSSSLLQQVAVNLITKLVRAPLLLDIDDGGVVGGEDAEQNSKLSSSSDEKRFIISPEEAIVFYQASLEDNGMIEIKNDSPSLFAQTISAFLMSSSSSSSSETSSTSSRLAAFLYLATLKQDRICWLIPRCDAAAFGASFSCYKLNQQQHSIALVWTKISIRDEDEDHQNDHTTTPVLDEHQMCGYIRLAKSVNKGAWILWIIRKRKRNKDDEERCCWVSKTLSCFDFELQKLC